MKLDSSMATHDGVINRVALERGWRGLQNFTAWKAQVNPPLPPHFFVSKRIRCKIGCKNRETILPPLTRPLWPLAGPRAGGVVRTPPVVSAACQDDEDLCAAGSGGGLPPLGSDWTPPGQGPPSQGQQANG